MPFVVDNAFVVLSELSQAPSLGVTESGNILLLYANFPDCMEGERLFLRRSHDHGSTWGETIFDITSSLDKGGVEGTLTCLGKTAFIFYLEGSDIKRHSENEKRVRYIRSENEGDSWSEPTDLRGDWGSVMPFGHAIRLSNSRRILLPAWGFDGWLDRGGSKTRIRILSSDDEGMNWQLIGTIKKSDAVEGLHVTETSLLELPDGRVLAISRGDARRSGAFPFGLRSISDDGGKSWSPAEPINAGICEPRLIIAPDGQPLLAARSWPGNFHYWYRPLEPHEREPGSLQTETVAVGLRDEYLSPVRDFGVVLFTSENDGRTWKPELTMRNPKPFGLPEGDLLAEHRYQAAYPDILPLPGDDGERYLVIFRQPDPTLPDVKPGLTYSHVFQRYLAGNVVRRTR